MIVQVREIGTDEHLDWIAGQPWVSFLQLPQWAALKPGWRHESLGWFIDGELVGAGLVRYRPVPGYPRRSLAYLPEGPCLPWERVAGSLAEFLDPLIEHCARNGAFLVKVGPSVAQRRWYADTVKAGLRAAGDAPAGPLRRLTDLPSDWCSPSAASVCDALRVNGWRSDTSATRFGDYQPRLVFHLPLDGRTTAAVFDGFNQQWRRNIRRAERSGVTVHWGTAEDLGAFHQVYCETAQRDAFTPRGYAYFQTMWQMFGTAAPGHAAQEVARASLACAMVPGTPPAPAHLGAAALAITVGRRTWYSYGASTAADRDVRPSNAAQWAQIQRAIDQGADLYDMRGIVDTVDPRHAQVGLIQFKVGTGGYAQEGIGEWDYVIRPAWSRAFRFYESRR